MRVAHELEQGLEPPGLVRADPHGGDLHAAGALLVRVAVDFDVVAEGALRGLAHRPVVRLVDATRLAALLLAGGRGTGHAFRGPVDIVAAPLGVELAEAARDDDAEARQPGEVGADHVRGAVGGPVRGPDDEACPALVDSDGSLPRNGRSRAVGNGHGLLASQEPRAAGQQHGEAKRKAR